MSSLSSFRFLFVFVFIFVSSGRKFGFPHISIISANLSNHKSKNFIESDFTNDLKTFLRPFGFEAYPMHAGWYNSAVKSKPHLGRSLLLNLSIINSIQGNRELPDETLIYVLISVPLFWNKLVSSLSNANRTEDSFMLKERQSAFNMKLVLQSLDTSLEAEWRSIANPPYYAYGEVLGTEAGVSEFVDPELFKNEQWVQLLLNDINRIKKTNQQKLYGYGMHPVYGGWFEYRGLLILQGVKGVTLTKPPPKKFLTIMQMKKGLIEVSTPHLYPLMKWRDLPGHNQKQLKRFSSEAYLFDALNDVYVRQAEVGDGFVVHKKVGLLNFMFSSDNLFLLRVLLIVVLIILCIILVLVILVLYKTCNGSKGRKIHKLENPTNTHNYARTLSCNHLNSTNSPHNIKPVTSRVSTSDSLTT